ncbi:MAG TPA: alpha/beta fold hydrolase [Thermoanaerobaculia bacterium]|nr:alpha/beta fold hydrolase [Thermoanaerobaculia bacterium]
MPGAFSDHRFWLGTRGTGFGRALADRGFSVWVLDPRGHGASDRPGLAARWSFRDEIVHDVPAALRMAAGRRRAVLVGHSAGGAAVLAAIGADPGLREKVAGVAVLATPSPRGGAARRSAAAFAAIVSRGLGRFPARLFRLGGEDEMGGVMAEWMGWNVRGSWRWKGGPDLLAALHPVPFPVFVAAGSGDRLFAPPSACRALARQLGPNARFAEFGRITGCSEDFGHAGLVVSRASRTEVWPALVDWIESVAG